MIKDLVNNELNDHPWEGLSVHIIKKYVIKTAFDESFMVDNFSVILIKSGKFKIRLDKITQDLLAHDLMILPKDSFCTVLEVKDNLKLFLISFSPEFLLQNSLKKELVTSFYLFIAKPLPKIITSAKDFSVLSFIYKLIYFINKDVKQNRLEKELQQISFNLFLYELRFIYAKYTEAIPLNFTRKESLTMDFLKILTIHCKTQRSVKFYAGILFVSPSYLSKIVKQTTSKMIKQLIAEAVIIEAKNLLEEPNATVLRVSEELEFTSDYNFSTFFKKHVGISPSVYHSNAMKRFKNQ